MDNIQTACQCCDRPIELSSKALEKMQIPMVFCTGCYEQFDFVTLRQWYKLCALIHAFQSRVS